MNTTSADTVHARTTKPYDPVRMIMSTPVAVLDVGATLREVAEELTRNEIGAVLVADASRTGLISERDLITAFSAGGNIAHRQIGEVVTSDLVWCSPEDAIVDVGAIMTATGVRHLPVGDHRTAIGIVSARDVLTILVASTRDGSKHAKGKAAADAPPKPRR